MDEPQEVLYLTSIDQARTIADPLRIRLMEYLIRDPLTVTQLGERVGESPAKVHYHVRELERIGVVRLVETRESERGGILEKYYRAVAKSVQLAPDLLRTAPPNEAEAMLGEWFQMLTREGLHAAMRSLAHPDTPEPLSIGSEILWATNEEFYEALKQVNETIKPLQTPRTADGVYEWSFNIIAHRSRQSEEEIATVETPKGRATLPTPPTPPTPPRPVTPALPPTPATTKRLKRMWVVGAVDISRAELEGAIAEGKPIDMTILGAC